MRLKNCMLDLHVHLDGSLSADTARALGKMQGIDLPETDELLMRRLQAPRDCRDLNEYLTSFEFPLQLLQTPEAMEEAVARLLAEQWQEGVIYSEIRFAPQLHTRKGMDQYEAAEAALEGLYRGIRQSGIQAGLILCMMRGNGNEADNRITIDVAKRYLGNGVAALDLAGAEGLYPTENYASLFAYAQEQDIPFTVHAGEADGPKSVKSALSFGARRIGHGVRAVQDKQLLNKIAENSIFLELCPTSNMQTKIFTQISDYPLHELMEAGVRVTINTDNRTVSDTTPAREMSLMQETFGLTDSQIRQLLLNAADAAFATDAVKNDLRKKIEGQYVLYCK